MIEGGVLVELKMSWKNWEDRSNCKPCTYANVKMWNDENLVNIKPLLKGHGGKGVNMVQTLLKLNNLSTKKLFKRQKTHLCSVWGATKCHNLFSNVGEKGSCFHWHKLRLLEKENVVR
jgi:hypothetical protein